MNVLITFAIEAEFEPWRAIRKFRSLKRGKAETYFAEISGAEVTVVLTGVGSRRARSVSSEIMDGELDSVNFCVSSGLAGGLRPAYGIGQVLAARNVLAEGPSAGSESQWMQSSGALVSFAEECGATVVQRFYSAEHIVATSEEKRHLGATADAVEMESFEILSQAAANGIPAVAIRAISDGVGEDLPLDLSQVLTDEGKVSTARVLGQVALNPASLPGLVKLGKQSKQAAEALAEFLNRYVARLAASAAPLEGRSSAAVQ